MKLQLNKPQPDPLSREGRRCFTTQRLVDLYMRLYKVHRHQDKGYTLVVVLGTMFALHALLIAYAAVSQIEHRTTLASANSNTGFYAAEAGLNLRSEAIRAQFLDFGRPSGTSPSNIEACTDGNNGNNGSGDFACESDEFGGQDGKLRHTASTYVVENPGNPRISVIPRGEPFQNANMQEYSYRLRSAANKTSDPAKPEALLEMDIRSRVVPLFQFAAFYKNDLEILPGVRMDLNGPVHTNASLYLGADPTLNITGQVTTVGDLFNKRKNDNSTYPDGRVRVANAVSTLTNLLSANGGSPTASALSPANLTSIFGNQIQVGIEPVEIPEMSFLSRDGEYFEKADLRIEYRPNGTVPVAVTAIKRNRIGAPETTLSQGEARSLLQPVMIDTSTTGLNCPAPVALPTNPMTAAQNAAVAKALQVAIVSAQTPVSLSTLQSSNTLGTLNTGALTPAPSAPTLETIVKAQLVSTGLTATVAQNRWNTRVSGWTANQVTALVSTPLGTPPVIKCFKAAPLIVNTNFHNNREGDKLMSLLQINIEELTVWNRDGIYVEFSGGTVTNNNGNNGLSADQRLFDRAAANANAPANSFQNLGLAAVDGSTTAGSRPSEAGLVFHASVVPTVAGDIANASGTNSRYGFAVTNGARLPGLAVNASQTDPTGLAIASDQAVYIQGDYNTVNKQPAAVLADSLNVLSNACINTATNILNCGIDGSRPNASDTTINSAFLAGTDITNSANTPGYNGGLENYPRFHETWNPGTQRVLTYRGSFISLGTPLHVRGTWTNQLYNAPGRTWSYETEFNDFAKLPPMTPNFVYLRQDLFVRNFDR